MKKQYTKRQIQEAISYWERRLVAEAKDPSEYESLDGLKKALDAELAGLSKTGRGDVERIKDSLGDLDDGSGIYFGDAVYLPSGKTVWDVVGGFFMKCCDLLVYADRSSEFPAFEDRAVCAPLARILAAAAALDPGRRDSAIARDFADGAIRKWADEDEERPGGCYAYSVRLDWRDGLKILREYAKKFYDVWAENFRRLGRPRPARPGRGRSSPGTTPTRGAARRTSR